MPDAPTRMPPGRAGGRQPRRRPQAAAVQAPPDAERADEAARHEGPARADARPYSEAEDARRAAETERPSQNGQRSSFNRGGRRSSPAPAAQQPETGQRAPQPQPGQPRGSIESLIARQNVLFEDFANQQAQAITEIQRSVQNLGGRITGTGAGGTAIMPKVGVFLDVPNLMYAAEQANVRVHFGKLLNYLTQGRQLVRATAYAPITDDPATRYELQRFVAPVINQGYKVVTKPWKRFADGGMKANFDIELAVDILTMADRLDIVVLLSGDGDFRRVLELVESKGVRVEVVAFASSTALELRAVADQYTDIGAILNQVSV